MLLKEVAMPELLSLLASVLLTIVIIIYLRQVINGDSVPNPATWFIWMVATTLNALTYLSIMDGNFVKSSITFVSAAGLTSIFLYAIIRGKFGPLGKVEVGVLLLSIVIGIFWRVSGNAVVSNLALQSILFISFIPTIRGLLKGELREKVPPWILAVLGHSCQTVAVLLDWSNNHWASVASPVINGILGNGSVAVIVIIQIYGFLKPQTQSP